MAQKSQLSSGVEAILKRKPISELRLQDPELWDKVSWIRAHFVKDLDSGIRKMDFCNFVTEHLGRTGYRDVWHLLKIAYPHVDRVRKGRKYMYWGIRHADIDEKDSSLESNKTTECNNNDCQMQRKLSALEGVACFERFPSIIVKTEKISDAEDTAKSDNFLVLEFKEKDVFESFEDYEKSKGEMICSGKDVERSVTPPLAIFSENQMTNSSVLIRKKSLSCKQPDKLDEKNPTEEKEQNEKLTPNLLKPENINRVCIPLLHDVKKRSMKKTGGNDTVDASSAVDKSPLDPVIVSVASIGGLSNANQSCTQQNARSDIQFVVVQDRGIQVCETLSKDTSQRRKRNAAQEKSTDCDSSPIGTATTVFASKWQPENNSRKRMKQSATYTTAPVGVEVNDSIKQSDPINLVKVAGATLPSRSKGFTADVASSSGVNGQSLVVIKPPVKSSNTTTMPVASSPYIMTSLLRDRIDKGPDVALPRARHDQVPAICRNSNGSMDNELKTREIQNHSSHLNSSAVRPVAERSDYDQFKNRELIRKLLKEHESQINSKSYSSKNDLQYTVDCLSVELEKERSLRLRLEIELRKVENQLDQERKLNESLAALLMKR